MRFSALCFACAGVGLAACTVDSIPGGYPAKNGGAGPTVVFDVFAQPMPDVPTPNDVATFANPTSRTGRRINVSTLTATHFEQVSRAQLDELEGWGTFAPITVRFARGDNVGAPESAIDLDDVLRRMQGDGWDTTNDPFYVVNLSTGVPVLVDVGSGAFPATAVDPGAYYPNDPRASAQNIIFETANEAVGACADGVYRPACDTDFDGVLDRPNTLGPAKAIDGVDNLLTWYERETDTLVLQPMLPLDQKTEYAVVLTDRLHGPDGQVVRSPFPTINHPEQTPSIATLQAILDDRSRDNYFGDIAGTGLTHVAFAWTFTTQPVQEDLLKIRDGLYGQGPFAHVAGEFPASGVQAFLAAGVSVQPADEPPGWQSDPTCARIDKTPYAVHWSDAQTALGDFLPSIFPVLGPTALAAFEQSLTSVDYLVFGTFDSPYFDGDPQSPDPDQHFDANYTTGQATIRHDAVPFLIAVPRPSPGHAAPFPVTYWRHGTGVFDIEAIAHAGYFAQQGIATVSFDMPGHGLTLQRGQQELLEAFLKGACLGPASLGLEASRAIDLDGDGNPDSGGLVWSAHLLHTRDGVRQAVVDGMQLNRILKSFDGVMKSGQDYNSDGDPANDLAGDFNGDGVVDVGGPGVAYYSSGGSFGGIVAQIHGAIDPTFTVTAPVSGGGAFAQVAVRSTLTPAPALEQILGPLVVAVPASSRPPKSTGAITQCGSSQMSVRWVLNDLLDSVELEIACLDAAELGPGMTVIVRDNTSGEKRCARTTDSGAFRVPIPTTLGDTIDVQVFDAPDAVDSYATCNALESAPVGRHITTWEQAAMSYGQVADDTDTCTASNGCQQLNSAFYPVGSPLVAPGDGMGLRRQTPDFRRLMDIAQVALDPSDPVNFAKLFMVSPPNDMLGRPMPAQPILDIHMVGDPTVPTAEGMAFSRALGALPFLPPTAADTTPAWAQWATPQDLWDGWGGRSPDQVLADTYETEGIARLARTPLPEGCGVNYVSPPTTQCPSPPSNDASACSQELSDADYIGEAVENLGQAHVTPPLRLARLANLPPTSRAQLSSVWAPRLQGAPFSADGSWTVSQPLVAMLNADLSPRGQHDITLGDPCQAWDGTTYVEELIARFLVTGGRDLYYLTHATSHECLATETCP